MVLFGLVSLLLTGSLHAGQVITDTPRLYERIAKENRIPAKLFYAIILNESRSTVHMSSKEQVLPWPWTINHRGKGYYFKTRLAAYHYMQPFIEQGESMGIGLGQIEWRWHKDKFSSAWDALDPFLNLTVAAGLIREQFDRAQCNTWALAVGCYHRPAQGLADKAIARNYTKRVLRIWKEIR